MTYMFFLLNILLKNTFAIFFIKIIKKCCEKYFILFKPFSQCYLLKLLTSITKVFLQYFKYFIKIIKNNILTIFFY